VASRPLFITNSGAANFCDLSHLRVMGVHSFTLPDFAARDIPGSHAGSLAALPHNPYTIHPSSRALSFAAFDASDSSSWSSVFVRSRRISCG